MPDSSIDTRKEHTMSALEKALTETLESRARRGILRRIPAPSSSNGEEPPTDFTSNDYLSLAHSPLLRSRVLHTLNNSHGEILGSTASRLLVNPVGHEKFERRVEGFFGRGKALLFNSGYDANVSFFSTVPQPGDYVVYDKYIHASVHDGLRASRIPPSHRIPFEHNDLGSLCSILSHIPSSTSSSVFVSVESLYSMDGTFSPLLRIVQLLEEIFPTGNAYIIVDEAHATGLYGSQGRGRVDMEGLGGHPRVLGRLVTFGKGLGGFGAILLTTPLIISYLSNYARPLIFTTALSNLNVVAASCAFDLLEDGTADRLARRVKYLARGLVCDLRDARILPSILRVRIPDEDDLDAYSPIIPLLTPSAHALSHHLLTQHGIRARPITWPTVPKGQERVRVCLHADHTEEEVRRLVQGVIGWARDEGARRDGRPRGGAVSVPMSVSARSRL